MLLFCIGDEDDDLGSFNFGSSNLTLETISRPTSLTNDYSVDVGVDNAINQNFAIGRPSAQRDSSKRESSRGSSFYEFEEPFEAQQKLEGTAQSPIRGIRDAFKVLPTDDTVDRTQLRPTLLSAKQKNYNEVRAWSSYFKWKLINTHRLISFYYKF